MKRRSTSLAETGRFAARVLEHVAKEPRRHAAVLVLSGHLGSGKTTFARKLARAAGVRGRVQSPTFVLEKIYRLPPSARKRLGFSRLVHIDAYRLKRPSELLALGFKELLAEKETLIVIEWGERVKRFLPKAHHRITFESVDPTTRTMALIR